MGSFLTRLERSLLVLSAMMCLFVYGARFLKSGHASGDNGRVAALPELPLEFRSYPAVIPERSREIASLSAKAFPRRLERPRAVQEILHALRLWGRDFRQTGCSRLTRDD